MRYRIEIKASAGKAIAVLPRQHQRRVARAIDALADEPRRKGVCKLAGGEGWRIRVGDYRIIYTIDDGVLVICVIRIGHRRDICRKRR